MEKASITSFQLFCMVVFFELGSAIVVPLGLDAKQDAWLAILFGLAGGIILFWVYYSLYRLYPNDTIITYMKKIMGTYAGSLIGIAYVLYFVYIAARVLRDFSSLLGAYTYIFTPIKITSLMMILVIMYVVNKGIVAISRTSEIYIWVLSIIGLFGNIFILSSNIIDVQRITPVLENGWKPLFQTVFPLTTTVPFGEMIVFTMIFPYAVKSKDVLRAGLGGMVFSGVLLAWTIALYILVLGVDVASRSPFPLLQLVGRISVGDFIQRLDVLALLTLFMGIFFKVTTFFYAAAIGITEIFPIKSKWLIVIVIGAIIYMYSLEMADSFSEHIEEGLQIVPKFLHIPIQIIIPLLILLIAKIKHFRNKNTISSNEG
jgi:spore germination protein KB